MPACREISSCSRHEGEGVPSSRRAERERARSSRRAY